MRKRKQIITLVLTLMIIINMSFNNRASANLPLPPGNTGLDKEKAAITVAYLSFIGVGVIGGYALSQSTNNLYEKIKDSVVKIGNNFVIKPSVNLIDATTTTLPNITAPNFLYDVTNDYGAVKLRASLSNSTENAYIFFNSPLATEGTLKFLFRYTTHLSNGNVYQGLNKEISFSVDGAKYRFFTFHTKRTGTGYYDGSKFRGYLQMHNSSQPMILKSDTSLNVFKDSTGIPELTHLHVYNENMNVKYNELELISLDFISKDGDIVIPISPVIMHNLRINDELINYVPLNIDNYNPEQIKQKITEKPVSIVVPIDTIPEYKVTDKEPIYIPNTVVNKDINTEEDLPTPPPVPPKDYTNILQTILDAILSIPKMLLELPSKIFDLFKTILQNIIDAILSIPSVIRELPSIFMDLLKNLFKDLFIPTETFINDNFNNIKDILINKYENDLNVLNSLKVEAEEFQDVKINLYGKEMTILSAKPVRDNIVYIRMVTSMFWIFLLLLYIYNQIYFLIRGTYPIVTSSKTTINGQEVSTKI